MIQTTLAYIGQVLVENFELTKGTNIIYADKEGIFKSLSENRCPLTLPAISYYMNDCNFTNFRRGTASISANANNTELTVFQRLPVKLDISIALLANNLDDYFKYISQYFLLMTVNSTFTVKISLNANQYEFDLSLFDFQNLSTPSGGKEGQDYDRGIYYVFEGGFSVNTFMIMEKTGKLVRNIRTQEDWTVPPDIMFRPVSPLKNIT